MAQKQRQVPVPQQTEVVGLPEEVKPLTLPDVTKTKTAIDEALKPIKKRKYTTTIIKSKHRVDVCCGQLPCRDKQSQGTQVCYDCPLCRECLQGHNCPHPSSTHKLRGGREIEVEEEEVELCDD
jgi:hypothetical protein